MIVVVVQLGKTTRITMRANDEADFDSKLRRYALWLGVGYAETSWTQVKHDADTLEALVRSEACWPCPRCKSTYGWRI